MPPPGPGCWGWAPAWNWALSCIQVGLCRRNLCPHFWVVLGRSESRACPDRRTANATCPCGSRVSWLPLWDDAEIPGFLGMRLLPTCPTIGGLERERDVLAGSLRWDTTGSAPCFGTLLYIRMLLGAEEGGVQFSPPLEATMGCVGPGFTQAVWGAEQCWSMSAGWGMPDPPAVSRSVSPARLWIWFGCREIYKAFS